jgi:hypothetical protein
VKSRVWNTLINNEPWPVRGSVPKMTIHDHPTHAARARAIWDEMSEDERNGIRFGIFPFDRMTRSEREGFDRRELCIVLFDIAKSEFRNRLPSGQSSRRDSGKPVDSI